MSASGSGTHRVDVKHDQFSHFSKLGPRLPGRTLYVGLICHVRYDLAQNRPKSTLMV